MGRKRGLILAIIGSLIFLTAGFGIAEENRPADQAAASGAAEIEWLWGEVSSVDTASKTLMVKYLDYDTDSEKEMTIMVNEQTTMDNFKSLEEIKAQDTVSIDYLAVAGGKGLAKNISLEKIENESGQGEESAITPEKVGSGPASAEKSEPPQEAAGGNSPASPETKE